MPGYPIRMAKGAVSAMGAADRALGLEAAIVG